MLLLACSQWLYGVRALSLVRNLLKMHSEAGLFELCHSSAELHRAFMMVYSVDAEDDYLANVNHEGDDPRNGDNNDGNHRHLLVACSLFGASGITIIDLRDPKDPAYCLVSIGHLECAEVRQPRVYQVGVYVCCAPTSVGGAAAVSNSHSHVA